MNQKGLTKIYDDFKLKNPLGRHGFHKNISALRVKTNIIKYEFGETDSIYFYVDVRSGQKS